ncbi:hypothetical protein ABZP36_024784 [Zizania latifolia]
MRSHAMLLPRPLALNRSGPLRIRICVALRRAACSGGASGARAARSGASAGAARGLGRRQDDVYGRQRDGALERRGGALADLYGGAPDPGWRAWVMLRHRRRD